MGKARTRLTKLRIGEISVVDRPASPGASVMFTKRLAGGPGHQGGADGVVLFSDALAAQADRRRVSEAMDGLWDAYDALRESIDTIINSDDEGADKPALFEETVGQFTARITSVAPTLTALSKALQDGDLVPAAQAAATPSNVWKEFDMTIEELTAKLEKAETVIAKAEAAAKEATERAEKAEAALKEQVAKSGGDATPEDVLKGASPEVQKLFKTLSDRADRAETAIEKAERREAEAVMITKVNETMGSLPGVVAKDFGPVLERVLKGAEQADKDAVLAVLAKANEATRQSLLRPVGSDAPLAKGSAEEAIDNKAAEIAKAEGVSIHKAFDLALERNPDLYARYNAERKGS